MTTRPVAVRVSQATRLAVSSARQASRMESEIWSAILSGWPSVTDSEVKRMRLWSDKKTPSGKPEWLCGVFARRQNGHKPHHAEGSFQDEIAAACDGSILPQEREAPGQPGRGGF